MSSVTAILRVVKVSLFTQSFCRRSKIAYKMRTIPGFAIVCDVKITVLGEITSLCRINSTSPIELPTTGDVLTDAANKFASVTD